MNNTLELFLLQVIIYSIFPFYFGSMTYYRRNVAFYIYLSVILVLGGFFGSLYSFPIGDNISLSGGNLLYGAFIMTIILLVMIENDIDVFRVMIRLVITVNIFVFLLFTTLSIALSNTVVINPFDTASDLFAVSIPFMILGGVLIVVELLFFLFVFEWLKRCINNIYILGISYIIVYIFTVTLDGILFPLFAFVDNPALTEIIAGNVSGKLIMGVMYSIPMILFLFVFRRYFISFAETPLSFVELLSPSRNTLREALRDSERRYRLLVDSSPYAIFIYQNEHIMFVNEAGCKLIGANSYQELIGENYALLLDDKIKKDSLNRLNHLLDGGENLYPVEENFIRKDQTIIPVEVIAVPFIYQGAPAIQIIAQDVTIRKQSEHARQQAMSLKIDLEKERELRELKSRFISMIVHDFRNPVTSIVLSAQLITRYTEKMNADAINTKAESIVRSSNHLNKLIDDVLELGRMETIKNNFSPAVSDIIAFAHRVFNDVKQQQEESSHQFVFEATIDSLEIIFDTELMYRALENLITNAVKYSPAGGTVKLHITQNTKIDQININIADQGIGIPPNEISRIFDFFHRADNALSFQGTGVGLTIVKQIIEFHDGTIECVSTINVGTTFKVSLPINTSV